MTEHIINPMKIEVIKQIHQMSVRYNQKVNCLHMNRLLELMHKHVEEISELYQQGNKHFIIETGDLLVLCFEVLLEEGASIDGVLEQCFSRYQNKLAGLLKET